MDTHEDPLSQMHRIFIELTAEPNRESRGTLIDIARLFNSAFKEQNWHTDYIDESEDLESHEWCYLAIVTSGCATSNSTKKICEIAKSSLSKFPSISIYQEVDATQTAIDESSLIVTYYRLANVQDNQFIAHTTSNVALHHLPTDTKARCQRYRNRQQNYEDALAFLKAKLFGKINLN